jgi:hypothetical protein
MLSGDIQGRIQDFKLGGGGAHLKKLRRAEGGANIFGVFRVKNHNFTQKINIFSNFRGGARRVRPPPESAPDISTIHHQQHDSSTTSPKGLLNMLPIDPEVMCQICVSAYVGGYNPFVTDLSTHIWYYKCHRCFMPIQI